MKRLLLVTMLTFISGAHAQDDQSAEHILAQVGSVLQRTAAEVAAGSVPLSSGYPVGNPLRYMRPDQIADVQTCAQSLDVTAAVQAAINVMGTAGGSHAWGGIVLPPGCFVISSLTIPDGYFMDIAGSPGWGTRLVQKAGASSPLINWSRSTCCLVTRSRIHDLMLQGAKGSQDVIHIAGVSGFWLERLLINDVPARHDAIHIDGAGGVHMHEAHIKDIEIYNGFGAGGNAGIEMGPLTSDSEIDSVTMEGGHTVAYGLLVDPGSQSTSVSNVHLANVTTNVVKLSGANNFWRFNNVYLDFSDNGDILSISGGAQIQLTGGFFYHPPTGKTAVTLENTTQFSANNVMFASYNKAAAALAETGTSDNNSVSQIIMQGSYAVPAVLVGIHSVWRVSGSDLILGGVASSLAGGERLYVGNGAGASAQASVAVPVPLGGVIRQLSVHASTAPGGSERFTATVYDGSTSTACTATIAGTAVSATTGCFVSVSAGNSLSTQVVASERAATASVRTSLMVNQ